MWQVQWQLIRRILHADFPDDARLDLLALLLCQRGLLRREQGEVGDFIGLRCQEVLWIALLSTVYAIHVGWELRA